MGTVLNFDATAVQYKADFQPLPAGWYTATITGAEQKIAKSGNGEYLQIEFAIAYGAHEGRKVWDRLLLWHSSAEAVEIAKQTLSGICSALSIAMLKDSDQLLNQQLDIKLKIRKSPDYGDSNEVAAYRPKQNAIQPAPAAAANPGEAQQVAAAAPWQK
jgi:hypothetical protein